jgi:peptidoglycan/LPS O-acetylase OafA/YrhL
MTGSGEQGAGSGFSHLPQLDGLGALAILFVLIQHGFPDQSTEVSNPL